MDYSGNGQTIIQTILSLNRVSTETILNCFHSELQYLFLFVWPLLPYSETWLVINNERNSGSNRFTDHTESCRKRWVTLKWEMSRLAKNPLMSRPFECEKWKDQVEAVVERQCTIEHGHAYHWNSVILSATREWWRWVVMSGNELMSILVYVCQMCHTNHIRVRPVGWAHEWLSSVRCQCASVAASGQWRRITRLCGQRPIHDWAVVAKWGANEWRAVPTSAGLQLCFNCFTWVHSWVQFLVA